MIISWFVKQFSRVTSSGSYIRELDGIRCVCCMCVVLFHLGGWYIVRSQQAWAVNNLAFTIATSLDFSVRMFFVLSGFLVSLPIAKRIIRGEEIASWKPFFLRRVTRLEPSYFINLFFLSLIILALHIYNWDQLRWHLLASMLYMHAPIYRSMSQVNYVAWSLEVEAAFYCLVPLLIRVFQIESSKARLFIIATFMLVAPILQVTLIPNGSWLSITLLSHIQFFAAGFLFTEIYLSIWKQSLRQSLRWDAIAVCILIATNFFKLFSDSNWGTNVTYNISQFIDPVILLLMFTAVLRSKVLSSVMRHPFMAAIGTMSYTICLYHSQIISWVGRLLCKYLVFPNVPYEITAAIHILVLLAVVICICGGLFILFERPFMNKNWYKDLAVYIENVVGKVRSRYS